MEKLVTILDGGTGKLLERSGAPFRQPEWSALALLEAPDAVRSAHLEFIAAGAEVITVNSYAVVPFHLGQDRFEERGSELIKLAAGLAREAADSVDRPVRVAACMPPLFGSYEPEKFEPAIAPGLYEIFVQAQRPFVDLWMAETMSSVEEAVAVIDAVQRGAGVEAETWVSYSVPEDNFTNPAVLRSGEPVQFAVAAIADRVSAVLFNCSTPEAISTAVQDAASIRRSLVVEDEAVSFEIGAFANAFAPRGGEYSANSVLLAAREELTPEAYHGFVERWIEFGASIVGGCCHIYPEHIAELARRAHH